jgi:flagellar hook-basal body complex protein FliE
MSSPISPISAIQIPDMVRPAGASASGGTFQDALSAAIQRVEGSSQEASASIDRFLSGEGEELHTTVMAVQRADLTFQLFLQARNKVVSAYQEIMKMQM